MSRAKAALLTQMKKMNTEPKQFHYRRVDPFPYFFPYV